MTTTNVIALPTSHRSQAKLLYWQGWRMADIADHLSESADVIRTWKARDKWDEATPADRVSATLEARLCSLIAKESKSNGDYKELDALNRQLLRFTGGDNGSSRSRESGGGEPRSRRARLGKNEIGDEGLIALEEAFHSSLFDFQRRWWEASLTEHIRNVLKARQLGATWYFAREAILDAYKTGKSKIFLSASKKQALNFRKYMAQFVKDVLDIDLKGAEEIKLPNGATLSFLGTNSATAQGYSGDVYMDEYFWIAKFSTFRKVASAMATHKQFTQTYISTPSTIDHEAYEFWTGERYNKRRKPADRAVFDTSHAALKDGLRGADRQWRQIVTVHDAIDQGFDLVDLDELRIEYADEEFANLFECEFLDDSQSLFPLSAMTSCMVDSIDSWPDVKPWTRRPYGNRAVWIGYDPAGDSLTGDGAGLVVMAPARTRHDAHRIIEKHRLRGSDYETQAAFIESMCERYHVEHIGIDINGMGESVAQLVEKFYPRLTRYRYTPDSKAAMVRQAQHIIRRGRLQYDSGDSDITQAFSAIKRVPTSSGSAITIKSSRSNEHGHADLAWATMHALHFEPLDGPDDGAHSGFVEIYT
ncbi:terminase large subunit domain-containing protein [Carnimonas bestiolae]|uniref:terminase large subunit domain-containing protein n=1 Tax=Carnimonas bestiolae TaxID=3402172 RepID=UPI003F4AA494